MLKELIEKRTQVLKDMQAFNDQIVKEGRDYTSEDDAQYTRMSDEFEACTKKIERARDLESKNATLDRVVGEVVAPIAENASPQDVRAKEEYKSAFCNWIKYGRSGLSSGEYRLLQQGNAGDGGNIVPAQDFVASLIEELDNEVFIRRKATIYTLNKSVKITQPSLEADPADPTWTTEVATGSEDSTMDFGQRDLEPVAAAQRILVTRKLLANSPLPVDQIVRERMAYKFSVMLEANYLTGDGSGKPLGLFTAAAGGINTDRDVVAGTTTAPTADLLKNVVYGLDAKYWAKAEWLMHQDVFKVIAKLKDGDNRYLIQDDFGASERLALMGYPLNLSAYAPNTLTTGQYVGILGDLSYYHIADALTMEIQQLDELYAESNKVGFIGRFETDGLPVLSKAFVRAVLA